MWQLKLNHFMSRETQFFLSYSLRQATNNVIKQNFELKTIAFVHTELCFSIFTVYTYCINSSLF